MKLSELDTDYIRRFVQEVKTLYEGNEDIPQYIMDMALNVEVILLQNNGGNNGSL